MKTLLLTKYSLFIFLFIFGLFIILPTETLASDSKPNIYSFVPNEDDNFNRIFREGRDLIDQEEWAKAAEKFNQIVCDCPEKKSVDAAFYWLAFCYKKQKMYKEANVAIDRLLKNFPNSSWADDAKVMKYQVGSASLTPATNTVRGEVSLSTQGYSFPLSTNIILDSYKISQTPLDRQDEIKLAAFQSLFVADQKKAIETLGDVLKSNSTASEILKRRMISTLRTPTTLRTAFYTNNLGVPAYGSSLQNLPLLKETLFRGLQSEPNIKVKSEIIYTISNINDEEVANYLVKIYDVETNGDIKRSLIGAFSPNSGYVTAPRSIATVRSQSGETTTVSNIAREFAVKETVVKKIYLDKLVDIVKIEQDSELRRVALSNLKGFNNWDSQNGVLDTLIKIYDGETDEKLKAGIIVSFDKLKQKQIIDKLIDIAKNDTSDALRLRAIHILRNNKSPEVINFLEELIK